MYESDERSSASCRLAIPRSTSNPTPPRWSLAYSVASSSQRPSSDVGLPPLVAPAADGSFLVDDACEVENFPAFVVRKRPVRRAGLSAELGPYLSDRRVHEEMPPRRWLTRKEPLAGFPEEVSERIERESDDISKVHRYGHADRPSPRVVSC